ncbi:MAG: TlyA family rRNA (cytidine-2'-O)-methyltransferase [Archaeoglobus sp.]|nr:TlyA family rRNA (cytidine-2'-O)-methyltransferase [Archaeoglobus sp.]
MRIDELLVKKDFFSTRQKAKEAIKRGEVLVDGKKVTKPSEDVNFSARIEVLGEERPKGYWKLKELNEKWNFMGRRVMDLGSSAGGFLLYASEIADFVLGIEYSKEFENELRKIESERENVEVVFDDVFTLDLNSLSIPVRNFDTILDDLTLDPSSSYKALKRFLPLLEDSGKILFIAKTGIDSKIPDIGLRVVKAEKAEGKDEIYFLLEKG